MAIDETSSCLPTDSLLLKAGRRHFRINIAPWHWQLRSIISAENNDTLYFPTRNNHITRFNTQTRESETIKILSFNPRCVVAKNGWICCGGENGEFAVIRDSEQTESNDNNTNSSRSRAEDALSDFQSHLQSHLSVDSPPAGADASLASSFSRDMFNLLERRFNGPTRIWTASNRKYGSERVNCITIWEPPKATSLFPARPGHYPTPVAILANNDKTITIVGLHDCEYLDELELPDSVNRSVISPDGSILASICDDPFLYIHVRKAVNRGKMGEYYEWKMLPRVRLETRDKDDTSECRGSFATCFSVSGRYLAVGIQHGTILIFNVAALQDADSDPLITSFNTDRCPHSNGAVRDMAFCPGPYDLLAWTEHRGRIGIADARTNFARRQVIAIDNPDDYEHLSLNDRGTIDPRLLEHRTERTTSTGNPSHLARLLNQTGSPQTPQNPETNESPTDATERLNQPFTAEETAVLEAVQNDRRRREAREARAQDIPRGSPAWRSSIWAERVSSPSRMLIFPRSELGSLRELTDALLEMYREITYTFRQQRETLQRILERERNRDTRDHQRSTAGATQAPSEQERERRAPTPRRRSSMMQTITQNVDNLASALSRTQAPGNNETSSSRDSPFPSAAGRLASGWADLEALYNITREDSAELNESSRAESSRTRRSIPVIHDVWNQTELGGLGPLRNYARLYSSRDHVQYPDDTAGLAWSEDGQTLFVGAEDGVYEFKVNLQGRKIFPDISLR